MTAKVIKLPGAGCRHHTRGRCLYEEHLNPGFHAGYRCLVLDGWETRFEEFVDRVEAFGIGQGQAAGLWSRRFAELVAGGRDCPDYQSGSQGDPLGCARFLSGLCLVRLPRCEGICSRFEPLPQTLNQTES